jgi:hypothetical protein
MIPSGSRTQPGQSSNTPVVHIYDQTKPAVRKPITGCPCAQCNHS